MCKRWIILLSITNVALLILFLKPAHIDSNDYRDNYRGISVGDPESKVLEMSETDNFYLYGVVDQTEEGTTWTRHWVQNGPITTLLPEQDLQKNVFWNNGWTYPIHPLTDRVIVIGERGFYHGMIYAYLNSSGRVSAIYVGGT